MGASGRQGVGKEGGVAGGRRGQRKGNEREKRKQKADMQVKQEQDKWLACPRVSTEAVNPVTAFVRLRN